ncbi:transposase [Acanthamoeba polyphaga moumouvirus]|uniref:Putative transposase n=1 Tax=Acanthamoeba polyphaga moumouvirus TaxID=1269028 RepID=L7RBG0_9VIRU|nr:transposase [Acanthamoeba polyphaga moumouvirus]AGC01819.1 putative transposase [Acanthamoeba polyphaga moumouvirus]AQN68173.1 putative transposase [Saudi moumouvirus]
MFWNNECTKLSKSLWIPSKTINLKQNKKKYFKCDNPNITFNYFTDNTKINKKIKFNEIKISDNHNKKEKLRNKLIKTENTRYLKEQNNKKCKLNKDQLEEKHKNFLDKIELKVNQLDGFIRSRKIQLFLNNKQKNIIQQWIYDTTSIYNKLVCNFSQIYHKYQTIVNNMDVQNKSYHLGKLIKQNTEFPINFHKLRALKCNDFIQDYNRIPYCVVADIIKEFVTNVKSCITKISKGQITEFKFKYKKYNRVYSSIPLESHYTTGKGFYPSIFGEVKTNENNFSWLDVKHDYKLIYDKYSNKYYIHVPKYVYRNKPLMRKPIAIMDPGARTFQTVYGLDHFITIGDDLGSTFKKRLLKIDNLKSKLSKPGKYKFNKKLGKKTKVKKWKYKRAIDRHHKKMDHIQQELHYKTANYLCSNYDRIVVTNFSDKKIGSKKNDLGAITKRILGKLSHYKFRQRLQTKSEEYGCQYYEVDESFTSKTCCKCGNIHKTLGSSKIYDCTKCKNKIDRDMNAAICILIKNKNILLK